MWNSVIILIIYSVVRPQELNRLDVHGAPSEPTHPPSGCTYKFNQEACWFNCTKMDTPSIGPLIDVNFFHQQYQ